MKRHLFSLIFAILSLFALWGWWQSTRRWTSWDLETPIGIFKAQSTSSLFLVGARIMNHEHRWAAFSNADDVSGESMEFHLFPPQIKLHSPAGSVLMIPYWELVLLLGLCGAVCFFFERRRIRKHRQNLASAPAQSVKNLALLCLLPMGGGTCEEKPPFFIQVIDQETRRGVPLVELETVHHLKFVTDNAGFAVIDAPELAGREVFLHVRSHGYEFPKDGFGYRGRRILAQAGSHAVLEIKRIQLAERLCRLTGAGLYAESAKGGQALPLPPRGEGPLGMDSAHVAPFQGQLFWIWGDALRLDYPLGNFHVTAALSAIDENPSHGIAYNFFQDDKGQVRKMAEFPGPGPTWLDALVTVRDATNRERLVAIYQKVKPPLEIYEQGLCEFDPGAGVFQPLRKLEKDPSRPLPSGHPFRHDGFLYFGNALPDLRMPDRHESWLEPSSWEALPPAPDRLKDRETGEEVLIHRGAVAWSDYLKRWTFIFTQKNGKNSQLGEVWYAEAESPLGPWSKAAQVLTHDRQTFYNPLQHPHFSAGNSRFLYFEGTYTNTFSGNPSATPRYDYNQMLYRLDLDDPRLRTNLE